MNESELIMFLCEAIRNAVYAVTDGTVTVEGEGNHEQVFFEASAIAKQILNNLH